MAGWVNGVDVRVVTTEGVRRHAVADLPELLARDDGMVWVDVQSCDAEGSRVLKDYLQGVIEFYQTRTNTKMTIAAERLAVIAAVTLPITALSSVMGMNVIVNSSTHYVALAVLLVIMAVMSCALLVWAKRKGWW